MTDRSRLSVLLLAACFTVSGCGGGGGSSSSSGGGGGGTPATAAPVATATPVTGATQTIAVNASATLTARLTDGSFIASLSVPVTSAQAGSMVSLTLTPTTPVAIGEPNSRIRKPAYVDANTLYLVVSTTGSFSTAQTPSFTFSGLPQSGAYTLGQMTINTSGTSAVTQLATGTASGGNIAFAPVATGLTVSSGNYLVFTLSPGGAGAPSPTPGPDAAYACPSSDSDTSTVRGNLAQAQSDAVRRPPLRASAHTSGTTRLAVFYDRSVANAAPRSILGREQQAGARLVRSIDFAHTDRVVHVLAVPAGNLAATEAALRTQPGVERVAVTGARRELSTVGQRYFTQDPYFIGFNNATAPEFESYNPGTAFSVPGQWDMHDIGLDDAFDYSQPNNGSKVQNASALGSASVTIAVIDTGEDPAHPELSGKIRLQHCFVTDPNTDTVSSTDFETDPQGHGTDVAGIAAADINDGVGFVGAGGNATIAAYRVFPEPDDTCESATPDEQCSSDTADVAAAIEDAVTAQVNVISMSLGGYIDGENQGCTSPGVDGDPVEGSAVADAIAAGIVVVAAAGNDGNGALEAPACDAGVIAVGASSLDDGQANGSGHTGGTAAAPVDYVASYSDYESANASTPRSSSAWGIVAPGGDPQGASDYDNLHWVENLWTSTPFTATPSDVTFAGQCTADYPNTTDVTPPVDCRTLIAGTSMATPHVAGAAALIIAVNATYQSPSQMKQLLCETADTISDPHQGCGRLNVYRAMATALNDPALP
jgi:subtilisin family serine protease